MLEIKYRIYKIFFYNMILKMKAEDNILVIEKDWR